MFKALVLGVAVLAGCGAHAQGLPEVGKDTLDVVISAWRVTPAGVDDGQAIQAAYLGMGQEREKTSTGTVVAGAVAGIAGAILPIPDVKNVTTDLVVFGEEKTALRMSGPCVGFILFRHNQEAKWGKSFRLVRLDVGAQGRYFQMEGRMKVVGSYDLSDSVKMLKNKHGNWFLKLVKPLEPGRYAVANLFGAKGLCWCFNVDERLTPQDSPSELPQDEPKK